MKNPDVMSIGVFNYLKFLGGLPTKNCKLNTKSMCLQPIVPHA